MRLPKNIQFTEFDGSNLSYKIHEDYLINVELSRQFMLVVLEIRFNADIFIKNKFYET